MANQDQARWDERYDGGQPSAPALPACFAPFGDVLAQCSTVLELACGRGEAAVWLAQRGAMVAAYDISVVAVRQATDLAVAAGVQERCSFAAADFDDGLPVGGPVELVFCNRFRDPNLDQAIIERLAFGGLVAMSVLSEVGAQPGRFRAKPGELHARFADLQVVTANEADGLAWIIARKVHP